MWRLVLSIRSRKTDQFREGAFLIVGRTGVSTCPVVMMECSMGGLIVGSHGKVFRAVVHTKEGERLRKTRGLSYSRLRELLFEKIVLLGMDPTYLVFHSLRAGYATAAANAGVLDRLFKRRRQGWVCEGFCREALVCLY